MKQLGIVQSSGLLLVLSSLLISCGRVSDFKRYETPKGVLPIEDAEPVRRTKRKKAAQGVSVNQLIASPALSANINTSITVSLVDSASQAPVIGNFTFEGAVPPGVSFTGLTRDVTQAHVTSTVAGSVTVVATPGGGTSSSTVARITLTFTTPEEEPVFNCEVIGPQRLNQYGQIIENSSSAIVNQYAFFTVRTTRQYGTVTFDEVGTGVDKEQAYLYGSTDAFVIKFLTPGTRTLEIKARSGGLRPGALCHKEITVTVLGQASPAPAPACRIQTVPAPPVCHFGMWAGYHFDGNSCVMGWNSCTQQLPFNSLSQCEAALKAGMCPGYVPPPPAPTARWIQTDRLSCSSVCSSAGLRSIADSAGNFCASGENRPLSASGVISFSHGTWGSANPSGSKSEGKYCYRPGQKKDNDKTDRTVGCYCGP